MKTSLASASWPEQTHTFLNLLNVYRSKELFCDCVIACDRKVFHAHKIVLSMCSEFFETILTSTPDKNPVIILNEVEAWQMECLLSYMYNGETTVPDALFPSLCRVAKYFQIKGFDMVELHRNAAKIGNLEQSEIHYRDTQKDTMVCTQSNKRIMLSHSDIYHDEVNVQNLYHKQVNKYDQEYCKGYGLAKDNRQTFRTKTLSHPFKKMMPANEERNFEIEKSTKENNNKSQMMPLKIQYPVVNQEENMEPEILNYKSNCKVECLFRVNSNESKVVKLETEEKSPTLQQISCSKDTQGSTCEGKIESNNTVNYYCQKKGPPPLLRVNMNDNCVSTEDLGQTDEMKQNTVSKNNSNLERRILSLPDEEKYLPLANRLDNDFNKLATETENAILNSNNEKPLNLTARSNSPSMDLKDPLLQKIQTNRRKRVRGPRSWEFLYRLLNDSTSNPSQIKWEDEENGIFRLMEPDLIALRWGRRTAKNGSETLSYDSFARGLRYHYATGALNAVSEKSFVYQFGPKARKALAY